jgi:D-glycero-D-manno-heptose 1,7-bisphosphate phosphatase
MTAETVERIHETLQKLLGENGLSLLDIFYCPHDNDSCDCRKPKPGMLLEAARRHELDLAGSWMIGDNEKDVQAGQAAGCTTVLVSETANPTVADFQVNAMDALAVLLKERLPEVGDSV